MTVLKFSHRDLARVVLLPLLLTWSGCGGGGKSSGGSQSNSGSASTFSVSGIVTDGTGRALQSAQVGAHAGNGALVKSTFSDSSGFYLLTGIPTGTYDIEASKSGHDGRVRLNVSGPPNRSGYNFTLPLSKSLILLSPGARSVAFTGDLLQIDWTSTGAINSVRIELYKAETLIRTIRPATANDGTLTWSMPSSLTFGVDYNIRITDRSDPTVTAASGEFTIASKSVRGVTAMAITEPNIGAIAANSSGEKIMALVQRDAGNRIIGVTGAIFVGSDGRSTTVINGSDGRPAIAYSEGHTFVFENYTASTVDVGLLFPNGSIQTFRGVMLPPSLITQLNSSRAGDGSNQSFPQRSQASLQGAQIGLSFDLVKTIQFASLSLATAGCVAAAIGVVTAPVALLCAAALVNAANTLAPEDNLGLTATSTALGGVACGSGDATSCASLLLDVGTAVIQTYEQASMQNATALRLVKSSLTQGSGDVQITLTWDNGADVDLHVIEPSGFRIYHQAPQSPTGGQLDVDDIDGFGPENIFWQAGQDPRGQYTVEVTYFASGGLGNVNYEVLVRIPGSETRFSGTLTTESEVQVVTQFTR